MANILDDLKDALSSFESSVKKDLEEMREQKREVLRLRNELYDTVKNVNYVRHDGTVIVSAPNIILGNVDQHGNLIEGGGGSSVTIRANSVSIEGVGDSSAGGSITQRAASIRSIAVDPGVDGQENVVCGRSEIKPTVSLRRNGECPGIRMMRTEVSSVAKSMSFSSTVLSWTESEGFGHRDSRPFIRVDFPALV